MSEEMARTNADRVQPAVDAARGSLARAARWARENPDEVAVGVVPYLLVTGATARHRLSVAERVIISQAAYWLGVAAVKHYQAWKSRPAGAGPPALRKVS